MIDSVLVLLEGTVCSSELWLKWLNQNFWELKLRIRGCCKGLLGRGSWWQHHSSVLNTKVEQSHRSEAEVMLLAVEL
jgi:hypothetical protein